MGSGGGSSGSVDYPRHMKRAHVGLLAPSIYGSGGSSMDIDESKRVEALINTASSPYTTMSSFDPTGMSFPGTMAMSSALDSLEDYINSLADPYSANRWTDDIWDVIYLKISEIWDLAEKETFSASAANNILGIEFEVPYVAAFHIKGIEVDFEFEAAQKMEELPLYYHIDQAVDSFADKLDAQIEQTVYPRFERGMQTSGAVKSSAFAIGRAVIEADRNRQITDFAAQLKREAYLLRTGKQMDAYLQEDQISQGVVAQHLSQRAEAYLQEDRLRQEDKNKLEDAYLQEDQIKGSIVNVLNQTRPQVASARASALLDACRQKLSLIEIEAGKEAELRKAKAQLDVEANRIGIVAIKEQVEMDNDYAIHDEWFHFEANMKGAQVLGAIAGTSPVGGGSAGPSRAQSAIGGAASGAAAGAMAGSVVPGVGTVAGAAVGGVLGLAGGLL